MPAAALFRLPTLLFLLAIAFAAQPACARPAASPAMANATVLIVRHAEKPEDGRGLTSRGEARAEAYARYFDPFTDGGASWRPDLLIASADSHGSERPRLTLEPLARATGLPLETRFANHDEKDLAAFLRRTPHGRNILIAWHHGRLPKLIHALGGDPETVLPDGKWPGNVYDWVIELRFGPDGALAGERLIRESLRLGS